MSIKIGINGFGRIGKTIFRAAQKRKNISIVAINDISDFHYIGYMMKYDSTHGVFSNSVKIEDNYIIVNKKKIYCISEKYPKNINWNQFDVDIVIEATGLFLDYKKSFQHIKSGAKKVILTAPPISNDVPIFVMGINHKKYNNEKIISNASCTTYCLAPIAKIIHENFGIIEGFMSTIHAVTSTQKTVDGTTKKNWRFGRSAYQNIIPSSTGAIYSIEKILPELKNKLKGISFRVPISNVSLLDLTIRLKKNINYEELFFHVKKASNSFLKGILNYTTDEVVSSDFNGETTTSIIDMKASQILNKNLIKLISWYDNETGYSNKILDLIEYISKK
ncbi:MAG: type I glyceraldehyde-3-phosphate dehydrogenase [Arsenophonus sp.]|nr:MAG: type I glyceraldehyde-3-phosphate dehydrogenase [Arsenophonus sp.]